MTLRGIDPRTRKVGLALEKKSLYNMLLFGRRWQRQAGKSHHLQNLRGRFAGGGEGKGHRDQPLKLSVVGEGERERHGRGLLFISGYGCMHTGRALSTGRSLMTHSVRTLGAGQCRCLGINQRMGTRSVLKGCSWGPEGQASVRSEC